VGTLVTLRNVSPLVLLVLAGGLLPSAQGAAPDPVFSAVPFNRWLADREQTHFRWAVHVGGAELSSHQRLLTKVEIQVDGNELVNRRGHGQLVMMVQFQDSAERVYQTHGTVDLENVKDDTGKSNIIYIQSAFVLPGDYRVSTLIFDTKTGEHSALQKPLHVNPLHNEPLPGAWGDLPAVELLPGMDTPDDWFRPDIAGRLQLPLSARRPIRVEVLMNASSSVPAKGLSVGTVSNRGLAYLVPALKVLSQMDVRGGVLHATLLDIPKRRVIFEQDAVHQLEWPRLRDSLKEADTNKIDVHSLEHREQNPQFFVEQVRQRLEGAGRGNGEAQPDGEPFRVLIVLSGPMTFDSGEDTHPIELNGKPNGRVYYVRYHSPPVRQPVNPLIEGPYFGRGRTRAAQQPQAPEEPFDSLAPLLKPLEPRLFDVYSPEQFRKTVNSLLEEIGRL
jgi:hypothetical protein